MTLSLDLAQEEIIYPSSDGQPMADSTLQYQWITTIKGGCETLFRDNPDVFVAADLLWYPVEGRPEICQAPDTMVVFGRPKGHRTSYRQWREDNVTPQVVFEIRSHNDSQTKMNKKLAWYNRYGVEEYYLYEPEDIRLFGWERQDEQLEVIDPILGWISPRLGVRFELGNDGLELYRPDGQRFLDYIELDTQREEALQRAEQEAQRAEKLATKLRELNIDPDLL